MLISLTNLIRFAMLTFAAFAVFACSSAPEQAAVDKDEPDDEIASKPVDDTELEDEIEPTKKKKTPEVSLSTAPKKTGKMVPGLEFNQRNEFLGMSILKMSADGIRLDSPNLTAVFPPGKIGPTVFNPLTGKAMLLTSKNSSFLKQASGMSGAGEEETKQVGTETVAGYKCNHFVVDRFVFNPKTKQRIHSWTTEIWGTRDLGLPKSIIEDCSKLTMMPPSFGFPMRVIRHATPTEAEKKKGLTGKQRRVMIDTISAKKAKFDKGEFVLLEGYEPVQDEMALMMSNDKGDDFMSEFDEKPVRKR